MRKTAESSDSITRRLLPRAARLPEWSPASDLSLDAAPEEPELVWEPAVLPPAPLPEGCAGPPPRIVTPLGVPDDADLASTPEPERPSPWQIVPSLRPDPVGDDGEWDQALPLPFDEEALGPQAPSRRRAVLLRSVLAGLLLALLALAVGVLVIGAP